MNADRGAEVVLCDTSLVTALKKRAVEPEKFDHWPPETVTRLNAAVLAASVITLAEAEYGFLKADWGDTRIEQERRRLAAFVHIPFDMTVVREWARLKHESVSRGWNVGDNDLWIAATAAARSIPLASCDRDHARIKDARVEVLYLPPDRDEPT